MIYQLARKRSEKQKRFIEIAKGELKAKGAIKCIYLTARATKHNHEALNNRNVFNEIARRERREVQLKEVRFIASTSSITVRFLLDV